jgi:molybdenum-dependent DNA-binding transcriptional regulator ModE
MHSPLLKAVAGRPKTERHKGGGGGGGGKEGTKGKHHCPIYARIMDTIGRVARRAAKRT